MGNKICTFADNWLPCRLVGCVGLELFNKRRKAVMLFSGLLAVLSLVLCIIPALSLSTSTSTQRAVAWTVGTDQNVDVYTGIGGYSIKVVTGSGSTTRYKDGSWGGDNCASDIGVQETCDKCDEASSSAATTVIMSCLAFLPDIKTAYERYTESTDHACNKFISVMGGAFSTFTALSAISAYVAACNTNLPGKGRKRGGSQFGSLDIQYENGLGMNCLIAAVVVSAFNAFIHLLLPAPKRDVNIDLTNPGAEVEEKAAGDANL